MRVAAARPRHTSQGEEKDKAANAEGDQAAGDDSANQAKDGKAGAESSGQGAEDEEPTALVEPDRKTDRDRWVFFLEP